MRLIKTAVSILATLYALPATAKPLPLPAGLWLPQNSWTVDYANNQCAALRPFHTANIDIVFGIRPRPILNTAQVVIVVPGEATTMEGIDGTISFGTGKLARHFLSEPAALSHHLLYTFNLDAEEYAKFMQSSQLQVTTGEVTSVLPLHSLADVRKVLDDCVSDLLATWGLSRSAQAQLASFPKPFQDLRTYFKGNDYPISALDSGNIGAVEARLTVGADGSPRDCKLVNSSGHKDLDTITCKLAVERMRFNPARTKTGQTIESPYFFYLNWFIAE